MGLGPCRGEGSSLACVHQDSIVRIHRRAIFRVAFNNECVQSLNNAVEQIRVVNGHSGVLLAHFRFTGVPIPAAQVPDFSIACRLVGANDSIESSKAVTGSSIDFSTAIMIARFPPVDGPMYIDVYCVETYHSLCDTKKD